jgi:8-oxo-dGTP pyrophosphatase MutT (NUDIX family)
MNNNYAASQAHIVRSLLVPYLEREQPEVIPLSQLAEDFGIDPSFLPLAFHALYEKAKASYLPVIDAESAEPTGQAVRWDVAHDQGWWHASVSVLVVDGQGRIALQQRGETDSQGRWDISVGGHVDIGDDDVSAAVREIEEEIGLALSPEWLTRFLAPYAFRKVGTRSVTQDGHETATAYTYRTNKVNRERISVFIVRISEREKQDMVVGGETGATQIRWVKPMAAVREVEQDPSRFASAFKHLFGHKETRSALLQMIEETSNVSSQYFGG